MLLSLNVVHIALRYLSPYASGGRPLIRIEDFFHRCRDVVVAVGKGMIPWPTSSHAHWALSLPLAVAAAVAAYRLVRSARELARAEDAALSAWTNGSGWLVAAAGGAAWTVLSYFPNLFWYLSPRHSLLPSIGWSLSLASLGARAASRGRRTAAALPWIAGVFFAAAAVSDVHEGTQWVDSRRLRTGFAEALRRLPPPAESVFLLGAPRYLRRAPAFNLPHDVVLAAERSLGTSIGEKGDYQFSPTRRGGVFRNDLSIAPDSVFRWLPAGEANVLAFDAAKRSFDCVAALNVERPDGGKEVLPLRPGENCSLILPAAAEVFLLGSIPGPASPVRPDAPRAGGLALLGASAEIQGETTRLELEWRVDAPPRRTTAFIPRLKNASGALILDAVFPSRGAKRPYPMIWPLVDDLAPGLALKPGRKLRQIFQIRRPAAGLAPGAVLELDAYEIGPSGSAVPLGPVAVPVALKR